MCIRDRDSEDTLKFVVSSRRDMEKALKILEKYRLIGKTAVYFSPVFGRIQPVEIVDFLMEKMFLPDGKD